MTRPRLAAFAAVALALAAPGAAAETKSALTAGEILGVLADAGLAPQASSDVATGAPVFFGRAGDIVFVVRALDCGGAPPACENLLFIANFDLGREVTPDDFVVINKFNDSQLFGRAYVLPAQAQVGVEYVIELGGGVSPDHIAQNVARWANIISAFIGNFSARGAS
jgi:hypothetical protein